MMEKIDQIKSMVADECANLGFIDSWFYDVHLLAVERFAGELLGKLPDADREVVLLGVWLHDLQRVRGIEGDHAKSGAIEAEKVMQQFGYPEETIDKVKEIILTHSCKDDELPDTLEGKILASADAMSHYVNDFYLTIASTGERSAKDFKKWALEKLDRDYSKKIFFDFAKQTVEKRHKVLEEFLTMG